MLRFCGYRHFVLVVVFLLLGVSTVFVVVTERVDEVALPIDLVGRFLTTGNHSLGISPDTMFGYLMANS